MATAEADILERKLKELEARFSDSAREVRELRELLPKAARKEIAEIKGEWHGVHYKWWIGTLAGVLALFVLSYTMYTKLGWVADQRALPIGNDWLLRRLPSRIANHETTVPHQISQCGNRSVRLSRLSCLNKKRLSRIPKIEVIHLALFGSDSKQLCPARKRTRRHATKDARCQIDLCSRS